MGINFQLKNQLRLHRVVYIIIHILDYAISYITNEYMCNVCI